MGKAPWNPDTPITLDVACGLYPQASFKISTLRAAADRGELLIFRLGRRYHTTPAAMNAWVRKCQDAARPQGCISTESVGSGLSATDRHSSAQAALSQTVAALKGGLPRISGRNTNRSVARRH
jgi:hypothetical protein